MEIVVAVALGAALVAVCVLLVVILQALKRQRREHEAAMSELRSELTQLQLARPRRQPARTAPEFVITDLGAETPVADAEVLDNRLVLSATIGEPLVKAAAFAHGVRTAMSAENRNRIAFEVKRETRRARKHRKAIGREAVRRHRREPGE